MTKKVIIDQLKEYFEQKGKVLTADEYKEAEDAPIRLQVLKRKIGSWSRIVNMVNKNTEVILAVDVQEAPKVDAPVEEPEVVTPPAPVEKPKAATKTKGA